MQPASIIRRRGFTLLETVIAIGVLAVLLTGFILVFAPAAAGIKKAIDVQEADRLASTLERELVTLRDGEASPKIKTGFDKAFFRIKESTGPNQSGNDSGDPDDALLLYSYRGRMGDFRKDGSPEPLEDTKNKVPGEDYYVQTMMRQRGDPLFAEDIEALEGSITLVKCVQLVFDGGVLQPIDEVEKSLRGKIKNPIDPPRGGDPTGPFDEPDDYPEATIAFQAEFFPVPARAKSYMIGTNAKFEDFYTSAKNPVFSRNLAVRR
ncbi:MAG: type II secretion system protein [Akkermansiaceae bacterium]|nr:type II secretion system protein [Akkermansiaceae bacterium]